MSFSVTIIGTPAGIKRQLAKESDGLSGQSKVEFDAVRPALETIIDQNLGNGVLRLDANGHATFDANGTRTYGACQASVSAIGHLAIAE